MTVLTTCLHCRERRGCPIKADMQKRLREFALTRASFKCERRAAIYAPGTRWTAEVFDPADTDHEGEGRTKRIGCEVLRWQVGKPNKVVVRLDEEIGDYRGPDHDATNTIAVFTSRLKPEELKGITE